ncbi:type II toxin-antitoxin system HicB family antitoxin [Moorena producens JHB]|uniref:Type II toxin-antitoxin system HicB family antitoxin n=1 Tax=Moorena producens (strain JHB) TaxID=1454205 RepID=A0A9Q9UVL7_MOOP1|nr:type II toxin-antitoxin system HicB family antitoxin [Moorena producens]WAN68959.1 type II toxin-antitoxin system HicB family antitoxin [Moorena producens JHB]
MKYKEYLGSVNYNDQDEILYGKVEYIRRLISYEGQDVESLRASFHEAVDDYLELCQLKGIEPEKPFKINRRVGSAYLFCPLPANVSVSSTAHPTGTAFKINRRVGSAYLFCPLPANVSVSSTAHPTGTALLFFDSGKSQH